MNPGDEDELSALNAGLKPGDAEELAKLNGPSETSLQAPKPAPATPEPSFLEKADKLGRGVNDAIGTNLRSGLNGFTWGVAPKMAARIESVAGSVGHGLLPSEIDAGPTYEEALKQYQPAYKKATDEAPVTEFMGSLLTGGPEVRGGKMLLSGLKSGLAGAGQTLSREYGASPDDFLTTLQKKAPEVGLVGGATALLGAGGSLASKLVGKGQEMVSGALARNSDKFDKLAEGANRSSGRAVATDTNAIITTLKNARDAAADTNLSDKGRQRASEWLASPEAKAMAEEANELNLTRAAQNRSALTRSVTERNAVADKFAPDALETMKAEALKQPQLMPRLLDYAKKGAPTVLGMGLGHILGHDNVGALAGLATGAVMGKPQVAFRNMMKSPAFQNNLGETLSRTGGAVSSGLEKLTNSDAPSKIADYLEYLSDKKEQP